MEGTEDDYWTSSAAKSAKKKVNIFDDSVCILFILKYLDFDVKATKTHTQKETITLTHS